MKPNNVVEIGAVAAVDLDLIIVGLAERISQDLGITDIQANVVNKNHWNGNEITVTYQHNGEVTSFKAYAYSNPLTYKDLVLECYSRIQSRLHLNVVMGPFFVRLEAGKYKGSVGVWELNHVTLGPDIQGCPVRIPTPSPKNLTLLPGTDHVSTLMFKATDFSTTDKFGNTNEVNDIIVYVTDGKINFGIYLENDTLNKRIVLKSLTDNESVHKVYLRVERDMMNVTKMPSSSITRKILLAQLNSD